MLERAREEALTAVLEGKPLFKLFFDRAEQRRGYQILDVLQSQLIELEQPVRARDVQATLSLQTRIMRQLVYLGNLAVPDFPYTVCKSTYCEGLPRLLGRATVELMVSRSPPNPVKPLRLTAMIDGYAAPLAAGNFVDLVQRGFFNGLPLSNASRLPSIFARSGAVFSCGQPADLGGDTFNITGFVDPRTGLYRKLPLEILPSGVASGPLYRADALGVKPALPFRAKGSMGMCHAEGGEDVSEFFVLSEDLSEGSPLATQLDGNYTLFGFILDGAEHLAKLAPSDLLLSARVISGGDKLRRPQFNPTYQGRAAGSSQRDYQMLGGDGLGNYSNTLPSDVPLAAEDAGSSN